MHEVMESDSVRIRYKITDDSFTEWGPYTPYKTVPFYLVLGEGLGANMPFYVDGKRSFEVVVTPIIEDFVNPRIT